MNTADRDDRLLRRSFVVGIAVLAAWALGGLTSSARAADGETTFEVYWKDGIRADTTDGSVKLKMGGRIMNDWAFYGVEDDLSAAKGPFDDGSEFRRARLYISGAVYDNIIFKAQYDFAGGDADFKDMYIGMKGLPGNATVRVGHFKEPFGLEELTSSKYITFIERSLASTFIPSRNTGIGVSGHCAGERITWAGGVFRDAGSFGDAKGNAYNETIRVTGLPVYEEDGARLVHLGLAYSHKNPDNTIQFSERPESHLAPKLVDAGAIAADSVDILGVEAAAVFGPASLQGEYVRAAVDASGGGNPDFSGYYVYGSYFLTGEHRHYSRSHGAFSRVKPALAFIGRDGGGPGAWELGVRYSSIDLTDGGISGGELDDLSVGVNWHLNPNTRVMANYVRADLASVGTADIFQTRFQIDF